MPKCRWLKDLMGRSAGHVEEKEEDLIEAWVKAGYVEKVPDKTVTTKELLDKDYQERSKPVEPKEEKAISERPVDKAMKPPQVKKK